MEQWYQVDLNNISWDDADLENADIQQIALLPSFMSWTVHAECVSDAVETALNEASDTTGFCIYGCEPTVRIVADPEE